MRKLKICFLHPWVKNVSDAIHSLHLEGMSFTENFVWDDEAPDYLFASDGIVLSSTCWEKFKHLAKKAAVRIFKAGEAISPDLNIFDYAIVFDKKLSDMDRVASVPSTVFFRNSMNSGGSDSITASEAIAKLKKGLRFCNFIYSNGAAHPCRDNLFYALSRYKRVESLGHHLNNVNTLICGMGGGYLN